MPDRRVADMDELLQQMGELADEAGDWHDHLPYEAAEQYLENYRYRQMFGHHVDDCSYCKRLVEALHPREKTLLALLDSVREQTAAPEVRDPVDAVTRARASLDAIRDVLVAGHATKPGAGLQHWVSVQRELAGANVAMSGDSIAEVPWSGTVALSLGGVPAAGTEDFISGTLTDVAETVAACLLASRFRVAHVGDLGGDGVSERLFGLARSYGRRAYAEWHGQIPEDPGAGFGVTGYWAWPMHIGIPMDDFEMRANSLSTSGIVSCLTSDGEVRPYTYFSGADRHTPAAHEWVEGLNILRSTMVHESVARIAMGGGMVKGMATPSLAQDVLVSLQNKQPLYVLGGFGGCAHDVAAALHLTASSDLPGWRGVVDLDAYDSGDFHNGLDATENQTLANTDDIEEAMGLVLTGLGRIAA